MNSRKDDIIKEYLKLAKRANKRLYKLEKLSNEDNFKIVKNWAYARAQHDINIWNKGNKRFKTTGLYDLNINKLSAMRNDVIYFLNSKTSTKTGIIKAYKEKTDTFNKKYGLNWTWEEMANFFENDGLRDKFEKNGFASSTTLDIIATVRKNPQQIKLIIDEFNKNHKFSKDIEDEVKKLKENDGKIDKKNLKHIVDFLSENKLEIEDLL